MADQLTAASYRSEPASQISIYRMALNGAMHTTPLPSTFVRGAAAISGEEGRGGRRLTVASDAAFASGPGHSRWLFRLSPSRRRAGRCREDDSRASDDRLCIVSRYAVAGCRRRSGQFIQQRPRIPQIRRTEPFGEPVIDRTEQITSFHALALVAPEPGEAGCGA
jgi:hypothetical protein